MTASVQPFGNLSTATILVIGQDPRLQNSDYEAEKVFLMETLEKYSEQNLPRSKSEVKKYELACAVPNYIRSLARRNVTLDEMYVTNLCNQFLPHTRGSGTVLIPQALARQGVEAIGAIVRQGHFRVIVPMACQTFYYLCHFKFIDEWDERVLDFLASARPDPVKATEGLYEQSGRGAFLNVCGQRFHHLGIPVVPVLHVKNWPLSVKMARYYRDPMERAKKEIGNSLRTSP